MILARACRWAGVLCFAPRAITSTSGVASTRGEACSASQPGTVVRRSLRCNYLRIGPSTPGNAHSLTVRVSGPSAVPEESSSLGAQFPALPVLQ